MPSAKLTVGFRAGSPENDAAVRARLETMLGRPPAATRLSHGDRYMEWVFAAHVDRESNHTDACNALLCVLTLENEVEDLGGNVDTEEG